MKGYKAMAWMVTGAKPRGCGEKRRITEEADRVVTEGGGQVGET